MLKILKRKKGMSLIEILVGSLMFGLVAITVTSVMAPMMLAFSRANDLAEYSMLLDNVGNQIASELAQASKVTSVNPLEVETHMGEVVYSINDGSLERNGVPVFAPEFYKGKIVNFTVETDSSGYIIVVEVGPSNRWGSIGATLERSYAVRLLIDNSTDE